MDLEYDELSRMIDNRIADSLERIADRLEFDAWVIVKNEVEWLRAS
ncbi:hypothetical protein SEA_LIFES_62 [Microbacterium phage Lifes]|nr:hypothetical protein SEA_LIFES_62 [Microbacterium phage Lifes]USH44521.1 hypothetical protein SEA_CASSITA_66 [Microbacterium phage Cassita]